LSLVDSSCTKKGKQLSHPWMSKCFILRQNKQNIYIHITRRHILKLADAYQNILNKNSLFI